MAQFLGFLIFLVIAVGAFFVLIALSVTLPLAAKPEGKNKDSEAEESPDKA